MLIQVLLKYLNCDRPHATCNGIGIVVRYRPLPLQRCMYMYSLVQTPPQIWTWLRNFSSPNQIVAKAINNIP